MGNCASDTATREIIPEPPLGTRTKESTITEKGVPYTTVRRTPRSVETTITTVETTTVTRQKITARAKTQAELKSGK